MLKIISILSLIFSLNSFGAESVASVTRLSGEVFVNGSALKLEDSLKVGDKLKAVGKKSFIQFKTIYGSVILLKDGELNLINLQKKSSLVDLVKGEFFHYMKEKTDRSFTVKTKSAVLGVRGTKYYISERDDESYLCVCEGRVEAIRDDEKELISKDEDLHIKAGEPLKKLKANKMMIKMTASGFEEMGYPVN